MSTFMSGSPERPAMRTGPSLWTWLHTWGPAPGTQCSNVGGRQLYDEKTPETKSGAVMAWWLFVVRPTTAGTLRAVTSCPARACRRLPIAMGRSSRGMNHSIRTGPGGYLYTYWQEWAAPSYVYLKRCKADDGIHTELLHRWAMQPAFLLTCLSASQPPIWQPLSPAAMLPPAKRMRRMTCGCSGPFACSYSAVSAALTIWLVGLSSCNMMCTPTYILLLYSHMWPAQ